MYPTAEVRWFHRGKVPLDVMAWFLRLHGEPEEPGHRVDYYLRLSDADALGIKLRDGRIEIKTR